MFFRTTTLLTLVVGAFLLASPATASCNLDENCYGAMAAASWNDYEGRAKMAIGYAANLASEWEANEAAQAQCLEYSDGNYCEIVGNFSNGACGYITTGTRGSTVRRTSGGDEQDVYDRCTAGGYECDWPIGGCTGVETYEDE